MYNLLQLSLRNAGPAMPHSCVIPPYTCTCGYGYHGIEFYRVALADLIGHCLIFEDLTTSALHDEFCCQTNTHVYRDFVDLVLPEYW